LLFLLLIEKFADDDRTVFANELLIRSLQNPREEFVVPFVENVLNSDCHKFLYACRIKLVLPRPRGPYIKNIFFKLFEFFFSETAL
jgi:hypothetical protein